MYLLFWSTLANNSAVFYGTKLSACLNIYGSIHFETNTSVLFAVDSSICSDQMIPVTFSNPQ